MMNACVINVETFSDGKYFSREYRGEAEVISREEAILRFSDENGGVEFFASAMPRMLRGGEYSLDFTFNKGSFSSARMEIGENKTAIPLYTEEYAYRITEEKIYAYIKYYLDFGKEKQRLKVIITAKGRFNKNQEI